MSNDKSPISTLLRSNSLFIALSLILVVVLGLALLYVPKGELHLFLCDRHTPARDIFYRYYTQVAEWFPYVVCVLLLVFGRIGDGVCASSAMIFSALTTQLFKHIVNAPRPVTWFEIHLPDITLPLVEGVRMNRWFSFPSGHTTSFFALAFVLCIVATKRLSAKQPAGPGLSAISGLLQTALFALAALGGYSRIYLSQHFAADVFAGIVVGIALSLISYAIFERYEDKKWYNYRLIGTKKGDR